MQIFCIDEFKTEFEKLISKKQYSTLEKEQLSRTCMVRVGPVHELLSRVKSVITKAFSEDNRLSKQMDKGRHGIQTGGYPCNLV